MARLVSVDFDKIRIPEVRVSSIQTPETKALLSSTIRELGTVQDIVVRDLGSGEFELVSGKSRLQELVLQGHTKYDMKVIGTSEKTALIMNITENLARGSYEYISVAHAIRKLRSFGATDEELARVFPWKKRWIKFIEDLQDLPGDVVEALRTNIIKPTHVQIALEMPTPAEVHDGLRTAIHLKWNSGIFKTYVQNRVEQIARARADAERKGVEPEIPTAEPELLIQYRQCLVCGYRKPRSQVITEIMCQSCRDIAKYVNDVVGPHENILNVIYSALQGYFGSRQISEKPEDTKPKDVFLA